MADLSPISAWTVDDVLHLGRRAGFGLSPEAAAALAAQPPAAAIDAWVSGAGVDLAPFTGALAHADRRYRELVAHASGRRRDLPALDFDTGRPTRRGEYPLADATYAKLLDELAERDFATVSPALRADLLRFYGRAGAASAAAARDRTASRRLDAELRRLAARR